MSAVGLGRVKTFERPAQVERSPSPASNVRAGKCKTARKTAAGRTRFPSVNALLEFSHNQGQFETPRSPERRALVCFSPCTQVATKAIRHAPNCIGCPFQKVDALCLDIPSSRHIA